MNSNQKGKRGEREWRDELRAQGYEARRGQQFCGGPESPDVVCNLPIHFEVKRTEKLQLRAAVVQASTDAKGKPWAVAHKWNNGPWLVIQTAEDWFKAVRGDFAGGSSIQWKDAAKELPDDETAVLMAFEDGEVWTGFRDAGEWRYVSADLVAVKVTHWAHFPEPPKV